MLLPSPSSVPVQPAGPLPSLPARDDYAGDHTTTGQVSVNGAINGVTEQAGDTDWFAVSLLADHLYRIDLESAGAHDPILHGIYDATGHILPGTSNDNGPVTLDARVWFTPDTTSTYYISAGSLWESGAYTLSVTPILDDIGDTPSTAATLPVNGRASGQIQSPGDTDWFAMSLQAGQSYRLEMDADFFFQTRQAGVFDASGTLLPGTDNAVSIFGFGTLRTQDFTPPTTGTYYLAAGAQQNETGAYTVRATHLVDDFGGDLATAAPMPVNGPALHGGIQQLDDQDWFAVSLTAGQEYRVLMSTGGNWENGDLFSPQIVGVFAPDNRPIPGAGDNPFTWWQAAESVFTAAQTGLHHIVLAGDGGYGAYRLEVTQRITLDGTAGNDWLSLPGTGPTDLAAVRGGAGIDMLSLAGLDAGIYANTATGELRSAFSAAPFDLVMESVENITGTSHADWFTGSDRSEIFRGLGGRDQFVGTNAGFDLYDGGTGHDHLTYQGAATGIQASLLRQRGFAGDAAGDRIRNIEDLTGSAHDDILWGDHGVNWLSAGWGDDILIGNGGNDVLDGNIGTDIAIYSGNRADYTVTGSSQRAEVNALIGGEGLDILLGVEVLRFADGDLLL